jgi:uncharacterized protein (DUF885 family)
MNISGRVESVSSRWFFVFALLLSSFALSVRPAGTQSENRTFPETGKTVRGPFLKYWNEHGGLAQQGFPISDEMRERSDTDGKEYTVQYFERAVFELHPEHRPPYDVLLSLLGSIRLRDRYPQGVPGSAQTLRAGAITSCALTYADQGSPTYKPDMPVRSSVGKGHVLTGYVLSSAGCAPIAGARVELWPDAEGRGHPDEYRATLFTDKDGRYTFESPMSDHIHMRISAHGYRGIFSNAYHSEGRAQGTFNVTLAPDPACTLYAETGRSVCGAFRDYWQRNGGLAQQGFPISDEFQERSDLDGKMYTVQYFERAVFESHPGNKPPFDVLLSQLGTFRHRAKYATGSLSLDQFYEKVFYDLGLRDPENFTAMGLPRSFRPDFLNNTLTNVSDAYLHQTYELERKFSQQLSAYDPKKQTPKQLISTAILSWYLTDHTQGEEFMYHDYTLNSTYGVHIALHDLMVEYQPITSAEDAKLYVVRLDAFPARIDGVLAQMRLREQKGIFMPGWMIDRVVGQLRAMSPTDAKSSPFYATFARKVGALANISAGDRQALLAEGEKAVAQKVSPSYRRLADYLSGIRSKGRTTDGVWDLPDGDAYYRYMARHHTNTNLTPDEIHTLGQREVTRIQGEIRQALDALGYRGMSLGEGINAVIAASGVYPTNTQQGKQQVLDAFRAIIDRANSNLASQFDLLPKTPVEVRATPPEQEASAPGGYYFQPSLDGTRPGVFYANLGRGSYARYNMPTLAYHEAVPGHHFQLSIQAELQGVPLFQKAAIFPLPTAFVEGWGLYAEKLAAEAGFYRDDPHGNIGRLKAELFRGSRLVVDTGIHAKRWTRSQAIAYMDEANGTLGGAYAGEVERYIAWPGQALAYKVGELRILELRERARTRLGAKFNIKEFHNTVLGSGSLPLSVLEQAVERYTASK